MERIDRYARRLMKKAEARNVAPPARDVACNGCTACCRGGERVVLLTDHGDDPATFTTETYRGTVQLAHMPNGDCVYLDRSTGCTIHERRPALCRAFDCVDYFYTTPRQLRKSVISPAVAVAAKSRRGRYFKQKREEDDGER